MEIDATVIRTEDVLAKYPNAIGIVCDKCEIEYSLDDYQVLKDNQKLVYFSSQLLEEDSFLLCHDCFFKKIKKISKGEEEVRMKVISGDNEIVMSFTPNEMLPEEDDDEDGNSDYLGLF